jgi:hypothetical protein
MEDDAKALRESAAIARRIAAVMTTNDALRRQLEDLADEYELRTKEAERRRGSSLDDQMTPTKGCVSRHVSWRCRPR